MSKTSIYLDNSTTTRPSEKAVSEMIPFWTTYWGVTSAPHQKGQELFPALTSYWKTLYEFVGASEEDQLILTSSGTEAVNHVIASTYRDVTIPSGKNQFLTSTLDEAPAIMAINRLESLGCVGKLVEVNAQGIVTPQAVAARLSPRTALLSLSWGNGLTGVIQPLEEIIALCKERGVRVHVDATHVMGKLYFDLQRLGIDFLTFNGEQFHSPRGSGILYIKKGIVASPFIFGSTDQAGMRGGAIPLASLAALAKASKEATDCRDLLSTETARLRNRLETGVIEKVPGAQICFRFEERLPHITTLMFPGISNEALLFYLNRRGVFATIGGGTFQQLTLLLNAAGVDNKLASGAVSFSLSRHTTDEEIDQAIEVIVESVLFLHTFSKNLKEDS